MILLKQKNERNTMKGKLITGSIVIVIVLMIALVWNIEGCQQSRSHMASSAYGLDRKITLYNDQGTAIKVWEGRTQVERDGASARFLIDGKAVIISGTFTIEEK
jgi:hypothetical protein